jgi:iron-sulfur cluster repair protein YtfE (RIC family)
MSKTKRFRDQHAELLNIAYKISAFLTPDELGKEAKEVRTLLSTLFTLLSTHLAMEDNIVYPILLKSADEKVKTLAQKFSAEMGTISIVLKRYRNNWPNAESIQQNPKIFIIETNELFGVLSKRIESEDNELYNAFDKT